MDCKRIEHEEVVEKYLAGRLDRAEREEFEAHYLSCAKCQEELELVRAIQEKLWEKGEELIEETAQPSRTLRVRKAWAFAAAAAGLLMIIGAAVWWQAKGPGRPPAGPQAPPSSWIALARFEPPLFIPPALRDEEDEASQLFRSGMAYYQAGRYGETIPYLRAAARLDPNGAGIRFFLGICLLLTGETAEGIEKLGATISLGDSAYLEEAHFYRAKALLAQMDVDGAKSELRWVLSEGSDLKEEAARMLALIR